MGPRRGRGDGSGIAGDCGNTFVFAASRSDANGCRKMGTADLFHGLGRVSGVVPGRAYAGVPSRAGHLLWPGRFVRKDAAEWRAGAIDAGQDVEAESGVFTRWVAHRL